MMKKKSNLDEYQEQKLLEIEAKGYWLAFWGLLAAMVIQLILYGPDTTRLGGEWIIFMAIAVYMAVACLKNGIWDRRLKADAKTNLIVSLIAGIALAAINAVSVFKRFPNKPMGSLSAGIFSGLLAFFLCFAALEICTKAYRKKRQDLEQESEEE